MLKIFKKNKWLFFKKKSSKELKNHFSKNASIDNPYILRIKNLSKNFKDFKALQNISFDLRKGERIGLIGGNGAGKTTLSEIISGINKSSQGHIEYGFDFNSKPQENIGMQFQSAIYPSGISVKDIINFANNIHKLKLKKNQLKNFLKKFQMEDFYHRKTRSLSGGQRQKINILMSILHKPKIVILDEFSTGLDISAREEIIEFTNSLLKNNNMSAILISHHMEEIRALCKRVIILDHGKIVDIKLVAEIEKEYNSLEEYMRKIIKRGIKETNEKIKDKKLNKKGFFQSKKDCFAKYFQKIMFVKKSNKGKNDINF